MTPIVGRAIIITAAGAAACGAASLLPTTHAGVLLGFGAGLVVIGLSLPIIQRISNAYLRETLPLGLGATVVQGVRKAAEVSIATGVREATFHACFWAVVIALLVVINRPWKRS